MKVKPQVEFYNPPAMASYAQACGWVLARAHAAPARISEYMEASDQFEGVIADFAEAYADQNRTDHAAFMRAIGEGRMVAEPAP